jgi:curved DNA-binding protein CbpA
VTRPSLPDHYAALGVPDSAPHAAIQAAYRRTMRTVHPDVAGGDAAATTRATEVHAALAVLRDPGARALYDRERAARHADEVAVVRPTVRAGEVPSWRPGGVRPITIDELREAAARESAYSELGRQQRDAFSAASRRIGVGVLLVGMVLLTLVAVR